MSAKPRPTAARPPRDEARPDAKRTARAKHITRTRRQQRALKRAGFAS